MNSTARFPETIDLEHVVALGNVDESLASFYADAVAAAAAGTGVTEREIRAWVDEELISEQGFRTQALEGPGRNGTLVLVALENAHVIRADSRRGAQWYELAHDRLVGPVRESNAAWRLANLSGAQLDAIAWERQGRPDELLATGDGLTAATAWAAAHPDDVLPADGEYLEASRRRERELLAMARTSRRARTRGAMAIGLAIAMAFAGFIILGTRAVAARARQDADRKAELAVTSEAAAKQSEEKAREAAAEAEKQRQIALDKAIDAQESEAKAQRAAADARDSEEKAKAAAADALRSEREAQRAAADARISEESATAAAKDAEAQRGKADAAAQEAIRQRARAVAAAADARTARDEAVRGKIACSEAVDQARRTFFERMQIVVDSLIVEPILTGEYPNYSINAQAEVEYMSKRVQEFYDEFNAATAGPCYAS